MVERTEELTRPERRSERDAQAAPPVAQVREEDLEPHAGLRYVASLFKILALLLVVMLIAEIIIGFQQEGTGAIGTLLIEATRLIVFAGFLWGAGDLALMMIESNHDLRATRILLGRVHGKLEKLVDGGSVPGRLSDRGD